MIPLSISHPYDFFWISSKFGISRISSILAKDILVVLPTCFGLILNTITPFLCCLTSIFEHYYHLRLSAAHRRLTTLKVKKATV